MECRKETVCGFHKRNNIYTRRYCCKSPEIYSATVVLHVSFILHKQQLELEYPTKYIELHAHEWHQSKRILAVPRENKREVEGAVDPQLPGKTSSEWFLFVVDAFTLANALLEVTRYASDANTQA